MKLNWKKKSHNEKVVTGERKIARCQNHKMGKIFVLYIRVVALVALRVVV